MNTDQRPFHLVPLGSRGMLLFYHTTLTATANSQWVFKLYDINLRLSWTKTIPLHEDFSLVSEDKNQNTLVLLFSKDGKKNTASILTILKLDIIDGTFIAYEETIEEKAIPHKIILLDHAVLVYAVTKDDKALLVRKSFSEGNSVSYKLSEGQKTIADHIQYDTSSKKICLIAEVFVNRKHCMFQLIYLDLSLNVVNKMMIDLTADNKSINGLRIVRLDSQKTLLLGSYSNRSDKDFEESQHMSEESTGFFSLVLKDNSILETNYYNFLNFKNFYKRLRGSQAIHEQKTGKKEKESSSDYRLSLHDIQVKDNEFLLVGEAYYPEYHTITNWVYDYYGHMIPNTYTVFDGYRYNNAFVASFDSLGKLLWDNNLEINNLLTQDLYERVLLLFDGPFSILAYSSEGKIGSKVFQGNLTLEGITLAPIESMDRNDRLVNEEESQLKYWYNNFFLAYGYQEIRNASLSESRRNVFYINKIAYR